MAFADLSPMPPGVALLQRSLERGRLGHAYLFHGDRLEDLERLARTLAKTLNCQSPPRRAANGLALDCCDQCTACRKTESDLHADAHWLRPESKLRVILVDQVRALLESVYLKPTEGAWKVAILCAADRLNVQAANAFLKTLEEPPPRCVLLLLTTEPQRMLETVLSRCLRLNCSAGQGPVVPSELAGWLKGFAERAAGGSAGLLSRYGLLDHVFTELEARRTVIDKSLSEASPLEKYDDADPELRERWENELKAAIESEYRRQRAELLAAVQWWLRDVWIGAQGLGLEHWRLPELGGFTEPLARRLAPRAAATNLEVIERTIRLLATNVQEALTLEVGLLKLQL